MIVSYKHFASGKMMLLERIIVEQRVGDEVRRYAGTVTFIGASMFQIETASSRILTFWYDTSHMPALKQTVRHVLGGAVANGRAETIEEGGGA